MKSLSVFVAMLAVGLALVFLGGAADAQTPPQSGLVRASAGPSASPPKPKSEPSSPAKKAPSAAEITAAATEAQKASKLVDDWHAQCEYRLEAIEKLLTQFEQKQISASEAEVRTVEELKSLIPILKKCADDLTLGFNEVSGDIDNYRRALLAAPSRFESLAALYKKQAESESEPFFVDQYKVLAEQALLVGGSMSARLQDLDVAYEAAASRQHWISRSAVYLDHLSTFLESMPTSQTSQRIDDFLKAIDVYADDLQRTIQAFKGFSKQISTKENEPSTGRHNSLPENNSSYPSSAATPREPKQPVDSSYWARRQLARSASASLQRREPIEPTATLQRMDPRPFAE